MSKIELFTDRRWHDSPGAVRGEYVGGSKNEALRIARFMLEKGHITEERYQEELAEIEKNYEGHDPDELI